MMLRMVPAAYVDESVPDPRLDPGTYLLACAVVDDESSEDLRAELRALLLPGQRKLHWHGEDRARRKQLVDFVAEVPAAHVIVVRTAGTEHSERRRKLCLGRLLEELQDRGVSTVALAARENKQNQRDLRLLAGLRASRRLGSELRMDHPRGPAEPLLWLPDIAAGALSMFRQGQVGYFDRLAHAATVLEA